jgi:VIT family
MLAAHRCGVCDAGGTAPSTEANAVEDVVGSAAGSNFVAFASGAVISLLAFFATSGLSAIVASAVLVGVTLFATGATVGVLTIPLVRRRCASWPLGGRRPGAYALGRVFGRHPRLS